RHGALDGRQRRGGRPLMRKHGKRFRALAQSYDPARLYDPAEATAVVKRNATAKFDETVEIHIRLGVDPKKADQNVRGTEPDVDLDGLVELRRHVALHD